MKLTEIFEVVPDTPLLGLANSDADNYSIMVFGRRKDAMWSDVRRSCLSPEEERNLNGEASHPGVNTYLRDPYVYGEEYTEQHVKTQWLIEHKEEEGE